MTENSPIPQEIETLVALFNEGHYADMVPLAQLLTERFPQHGLGWKILGVAFERLGQISDALIPTQKAADLESGDAENHYNLGNIRRVMGKLIEAEASYRLALKIKPDNPEAHNNLGMTLKDLRRPDEAEACNKLALEFKPDYAEAHNNLGITLMALGRLDEAATSFRRALAIKPNSPGVRMNLGNLMHHIVGSLSGKAFLEEEKKGFKGVRMQYENLPFPSRDPEAERYVLRVSPPDILGKINQYCFRGARDFSKTFRVLIAGCGTGDSAIWLAYQLKDTPTEIIAIDMSQASLKVAQARAKLRNLTNIQWINGSLLDVSKLGLGKYDYITCLGVLHHLHDPVEGLIALESVLADGGAMAIMLYGAIGRSHIYSMQKILRRLTIGLDDPGEHLAFAKKVVAHLPKTNEFRMREHTVTIQRQYLQDDTNFWDTLLHEQDRAYTASEVRGFLSSAGLNLNTFISYQGVGAITSLQYDLDLYIDDDSERERLKTLSLAERENIAEALDGSLALHTVYATRSGHTSLNPTAPDAILSPMSHSAQEIIANLSKSTQVVPIVLRNGVTIDYNPSGVTRAFLARIDGHRRNIEIAHLLGIAAGSEMLSLVNKELRIPTTLHWLIARASIGSYLPPLPDISEISFPLHHYEPVRLPL